MPGFTFGSPETPLYARTRAYVGASRERNHERDWSALCPEDRELLAANWGGSRRPDGRMGSPGEAAVRRRREPQLVTEAASPLGSSRSLSSSLVMSGRPAQQVTLPRPDQVTV